MRCLVLAVTLSACVSSNVVVCDDGRVCPATKVCDEEHDLCVFTDQLVQCDQEDDRTPCTIVESFGDVTAGTCHENVCLPAACGNNRLDRIEDELCDDSNTLAGDGCSADCTSLEVCGNGNVDLLNPRNVAEQCDDSNFVAHDGCTSLCQGEVVSWAPYVDPVPQWDVRLAYDVARNTVVMTGGYRSVTPFFSGLGPAMGEWNGVWDAEITAPPPPSVRFSALAYDLELRRTIRYGGTDSVGVTGETWSWNGLEWQQEASGPPRKDHAMAYDPKRKRVVVFGGRDASDEIVDTTLEFDGTSWQEITPANRPAARTEARMAYDAQRGVIVMVAGGIVGAADPPGSVWEYDGTTWTRKVPSGEVPTYVIHMAFAYDPVHSRAMLYGGLTSSQVTLDQMWLWDGTGWSLYAGMTPPGRLNAAIVYDGRGRMMLFGGRTTTSSTTGTVLGETWFFDGSSWTQAASPPPRAGSVTAISYDQAKVLRFGGRDATNANTNEVWERTRRGWKKFTTPDDPPARMYTTLVYDSARGQFVMFGGQLGDGTFDPKTYLRTGESWTALEPSPSPPPRAAAQLVFDAARGKTIMYGGFDASNAPYSDMWTWNGASWESVSTPLPTALGAAAIGYDPIREHVVVYGGVDTEGTLRAETWVWDGTVWHDATPSEGPPPMAHNRFVWNPARKALALVGPGLSFVDQTFETWEWIGSATSPPTGTWRRVVTLVRPTNRFETVVTPMLDGTGLEAAFGVFNNQLLPDKFELVSRALAADDSCHLPFDVDGDSLIGCADPDCWIVCSPLCPPGVTCPANAPRCGDGDCDVLESRHTCPAECAASPVCGDFVCDPGEQCLGDC